MFKSAKNNDNGHGYNNGHGLEPELKSLFNAAMIITYDVDYCVDENDETDCDFRITFNGDGPVIGTILEVFLNERVLG